MRYPSRHPLYETWRNMRKRCSNPRSPNYGYYGGRGIRVCSRWDESFDAWLEDVGPRPGPQYRLIRLDLHGDYEPSNCMWGLRGEEGSRNREWAIRLGERTSKPIGSRDEAEEKMRALEEEVEEKPRLVWRQPGGDWRAI